MDIAEGAVGCHTSQTILHTCTLGTIVWSNSIESSCLCVCVWGGGGGGVGACYEMPHKIMANLNRIF